MIDRYLELGWKLLPTNGKIPLLPSWQTQASNDPAVVSGWKSRYKGCNWGVNAGASGLVIVDIDSKNGATKANFDAHFGPLPKTPEVHTPSGGWHLYFKAPTDLIIPNSASKIMRGVDIRATGGQALIPPSEIDGLDYKWAVSPEDVLPQPLPPYLLLKLTETITIKGRARVLPTKDSGELKGIGGDGRWEICQSLAGRFRNWGFSENAIYEFLLTVRNHHMEYDDSVSDSKLRNLAKWAGSMDAGKYLRSLGEQYRGKEIRLKGLIKDVDLSNSATRLKLK